MTADPDLFDLARILTTLDRYGVEYLVVGGLGARAHGATRPTQDIDVVPSSTAENLDRLAGALRELGARLRVAGMTDEETRQLPVVVDGSTLAAFGSTTWSTDAGSIDVLHDLPTATGRRSYDDLLSRSTTASLDGASSASQRSPTSSTASSTRIGPRTEMRCPSWRSCGAGTRAALTHELTQR
jgi:hypothetical protein